MASALDILTLAEAKTVLNKTLVDVDDNEIEFYITGLSQRFDELIGPIVKRSVTDWLDGGHSVVFTSRYPVAGVTSVTEYERGTATTLEVSTATSAPTNGYRTFAYSRDRSLKGNRIERRRGYDPFCFASGSQNVEVVYTAGRATTTADVPTFIKEAAGFTLMNYWRSQEDSTGGVNEFYVPQSYFPRWAIPNVSRGLLENEMQEPRYFVDSGD